jgi:hypothetical protein
MTKKELSSADDWSRWAGTGPRLLSSCRMELGAATRGLHGTKVER